MHKQREMIKASLDKQVRQRKETIRKQVEEEERMDMTLLECSRRELEQEKRERLAMRRRMVVEKQSRDRTLDEAKKYKMKTLLEEKQREESMVSQLQTQLKAEK